MLSAAGWGTTNRSPSIAQRTSSKYRVSIKLKPRRAMGVSSTTKEAAAGMARDDGFTSAGSGGGDASAAAVADLSIWWVRADMRLADNPALTAAAANTARLLPIVAIDPRDLGPSGRWRCDGGGGVEDSSSGGKNEDGGGSGSGGDSASRGDRRHTGLGVPTLGPHRARLLLEAANALRRDLSAAGSGLAWRAAPPAAAVADALREAAPALLADSNNGSDSSGGGAPRVRLVFTYGTDATRRARAAEAAAAAAFKRAARELGLEPNVEGVWAATLMHPDDLPGGLGALAPSSSAFSDTDASGKAEAAAAAGSSLLRTMTDYRRALAAAGARPRAPLPRPALPLPPLPWDVSGSQGGGSSSTCEQMPVAEWFGPLPSDARALYEAAGPSAVAALERLAALTGAPVAVLAGRSSSDDRGEFPFAGGEAAAEARLAHFLRLEGGGGSGGEDYSSTAGQQQQQQQQDDGKEAHATPPLATYGESRMLACGGVDASAKLSPFLALGCLSPRRAAAAVEAARARCAPGAPEAEGCGWLLMHLEIRDYFLFSALAAGDSLIAEAPRACGGHGGGNDNNSGGGWRRDEAAFARWAGGRTGFPFVDAAARELAATGWVSNRSRQNAASFLAKGLGVEWRWGAELYESLLLDAEPAANYGNWAYAAGAGADPRGRAFKTVTQGERYDVGAALAARWLPELRALPAAMRHRPWEASEELNEYPRPMIDPAGQIGRGPKALKNEAPGRGGAV